MKSFKFCFLFLILSASLSFSQVLQGYGLKVGFVSSTQDYTNKMFNDNIGWKSGFSISMYANLFNLNNFSISPELKYIQKGWRSEKNFLNIECAQPNLTFYHNYLSILISLKYDMNFVIGKPYVKIAPRYDVRLKSYTNFFTSDFNDFNNVFGGTLSLGFVPKLDISLNPFVEISYHLDYTKSFEISTNSIKNRAIEISLGIEF